MTIDLTVTREQFESMIWKQVDDTIEHDAYNNGDELRVVLVFDLWNPLLEETDREIANQLSQAVAGFSDQPARVS